MNWLADKIEQWPTAKLLPYVRNARTHSEEQVAQIAASIAEFGFTNPILAGTDGIIVAGHGRLAAAQKLGLQFSNAQDYGDRYWLYVVEFVSDPEHIRVHPIRSPATQVTSFMFDGNWRDAVADERADPALAFIAGARVKHQHFGFGRIESMELRGSTRVMSIEFVTSGRRTVTLNLQTMTVVEEDDDNDHS